MARRGWLCLAVRGCLGQRKERLIRDVSSCLFSHREALPGLDSQAAGNHTYYHRSRQGVAAPSATLDSHELESLMSPLPEDAPVPLGDITELTEVHSLIHTSLPEDIVRGKRKVRSRARGDWAPTLGKSLCLACRCWEARVCSCPGSAECSTAGWCWAAMCSLSVTLTGSVLAVSSVFGIPVPPTSPFYLLGQ